MQRWQIGQANTNGGDKTACIPGPAETSRERLLLRSHDRLASPGPRQAPQNRDGAISAFSHPPFRPCTASVAGREPGRCRDRARLLLELRAPGIASERNRIPTERVGCPAQAPRAPLEFRTFGRPIKEVYINCRSVLIGWESHQP